MRTSTLFFALAVVSSASAKTINVIVGTNLYYNGTGDISATKVAQVFDPQEIVAELGDKIIFKFTEGNHTVTRSSFDQPCVPISEHNNTVNGFNSGPRPTNNGTSPTELLVDVDSVFGLETVWFYDASTCGVGGVGVINLNETGWEPLDGAVRNARRLYGPDKVNETTTTKTTSTNTNTGSSPGSTDPVVDGGAFHHAAVSGFAVLAATFALFM
ncbi:hypothetical protein BKA62DRAFT_431416 [Auriculariales sp. MPI-PUGE-AT-0066]|nr:hypothetical protein BKA62DRAFT_431416 [Auriculariales sp. MPI-PUGE-AT-0066]